MISESFGFNCISLVPETINFVKRTDVTIADKHILIVCSCDCIVNFNLFVLVHSSATSRACVAAGTDYNGLSSLSDIGVALVRESRWHLILILNCHSSSLQALTPA